MDERLYQFLKWTAVVMVTAWVGWSVYDGMLRDRTPGEHIYAAGNRFFEDGEYERALVEYEAASREMSDPVHALRGKAITLMQLGRNQEALQTFDEAIGLAPEFGATYANRGILHDRMGSYELALADYEQALALDPELAEGPHWMTRFLRLQPEKPPTIADRSEYLRGELAKPASERVLRMPEADEVQRPYKM